MDVRLLHLIATVIDACDRPPGRGPGHPPTETIRVVGTLRRFQRGGTPWRGLTATGEQASGSTLRRCLARWTRTGLLAKAHVRLASMLRGHPDLVLNACSVRAKRGGDLTGSDPTDRGKQGSKYRIETDGDGVPVACAVTAATSMTRSSSSGCSWPPSRSWPASARSSPTKAMTRSITATSAAGAAPSHTSTSGVDRADQGLASGTGPSSAAMPGCRRTGASRYATAGSASSSSR